MDADIKTSAIKNDEPVASNTFQRPLEELRSLWATTERERAVAEFTPEGVLLSANANFLTLVGYRAEEIVGSHHRVFCDATYARRSGPRTRLAVRH